MMEKRNRARTEMTMWRYLRGEEKPSNVVGDDKGMTRRSSK